MYTMQLSCTAQNEVFCAQDNDDNRLVIFVDDGSEVTLIAASVISKEWEESEGERINLTGIGDKTKQEGTKASRMVTVPLKIRGAMTATWVTGYVVPDAVLPDGIDMLVGKPAIESMGMKPDSRNMGMEFSEVRTDTGIPLVVNTMPLEKQLDILDAPPLRVLDISGGGSFSYQTLRDMDYAIELYDAIEKDGQARDIARCHSEGHVTHLHPHDLMKLNTMLGDTYTDILATPECAPWSRASVKVVPKGFDDERARLFEKAAAIIDDQRGRNPQLNVIFQNTEIHPGLPDDAERQKRLLHGTFTVSNASDLGGMSSRPRRIHSNMADLCHSTGDSETSPQ